MSKLWKNIGWGALKLGAGITGGVFGGPLGGMGAVTAVDAAQLATDKDKQKQWRKKPGMALLETGLDVGGGALAGVGGAKIAGNLGIGVGKNAGMNAGTNVVTNQAVSTGTDNIMKEASKTGLKTTVANANPTTHLTGMGLGNPVSTKIGSVGKDIGTNVVKNTTEPLSSNMMVNTGPRAVTTSTLPDKTFSTAINKEIAKTSGTSLKTMTPKVSNIPKKIIAPENLSELPKDAIVQGGGGIIKKEEMSKLAKGLMYANIGKAALDVGLSIKGMNDLSNMKAPSIAPPPMVKPEYTPDTVSSTQAAETQNIETALANKKKTDLATGRADSSEDAILEMTANNKLAATIEQGRTQRNQTINDNQFRADSVNQGMIANVNATNANMTANFEAMRGGMESELLNTALNAPFAAAQSIIGTSVTEANRKDSLINALATAEPKEKKYILAELQKLGYNA